MVRGKAGRNGIRIRSEGRNRAKNPDHFFLDALALCSPLFLYSLDFTESLNSSKVLTV